MRWSWVDFFSGRGPARVLIAAAAYPPPKEFILRASARKRMSSARPNLERANPRLTLLTPPPSHLGTSPAVLAPAVNKVRGDGSRRGQAPASNSTAEQGPWRLRGAGDVQLFEQRQPPLALLKLLGGHRQVRCHASAPAEAVRSCHSCLPRQCATAVCACREAVRQCTAAAQGHPRLPGQWRGSAQLPLVPVVTAPLALGAAAFRSKRWPPFICRWYFVRARRCLWLQGPAARGPRRPRRKRVLAPRRDGKRARGPAAHACHRIG